MYAGSHGAFRGPMHCATTTLRERGIIGLYRGGASWVLFAGPRSAVRFGTFDTLTTLSAQRDLPARLGPSAVDTANGFMAGIVEAALCQTPNQVIAIKMVHDAAPRGPKRYQGLVHAMQCIAQEHGLRGFFQGMGPAVLKGAVTNSIRFFGYGWLKRLIQSDHEAEHGAGSAPHSPPGNRCSLVGALAPCLLSRASQSTLSRPT